MGITETTPMTGYEQLTYALEHREPDRVPFDLGGTLVSGINELRVFGAAAIFLDSKLEMLS